MNRKQLRGELAFLLNFTEGDADQDFAKARLNKLLDRAQNLEVERAKLHGGKAYFQGATANFTWAASAQTLAVPSSLQGPSIIDVYNITSGEPGLPLVFGDDAYSGGDVFWKDKDTWQWSTVGGPGSALTLRGYYEQVASDLQDDEDEPDLIPSQFHYLLVWTAACLGRAGADDRIPQDWKDERKEMRLDFYKHVSKARPKSRVTVMTPEDSGLE